MTHERLLEAYRTDSEIIRNNIRIKKLLNLAIVTLIIPAIISLILYLCTTKALDPALKITQALLLAVTPILFLFAIILILIRLLFSDKLAHCVYDAFMEIYDKSAEIFSKVIDEANEQLKNKEDVLSFIYREHLREYLVEIFTEDNNIANPDYQMVEDYAEYLYDMRNWELSCIFNAFRDESHS